MMKRRSISLLLVAALAALLLSACGSPNYKDGVYTAQAAEFPNSGWKELVELTVEDGEIVRIEWDAIYRDDSIPIRKKQYSKSGLYGMMAAGSISEWYDQAVLVEQYVLKNGIDALTMDADGYADSVSGCSIHVIEFEALVRECLAQAEA